MAQGISILPLAFANFEGFRGCAAERVTNFARGKSDGTVNCQAMPRVFSSTFSNIDLFSEETNAND